MVKDGRRGFARGDCAAAGDLSWRRSKKSLWQGFAVNQPNVMHVTAFFSFRARKVHVSFSQSPETTDRRHGRQDQDAKAAQE